MAGHDLCPLVNEGGVDEPEQANASNFDNKLVDAL